MALPGTGQFGARRQTSLTIIVQALPLCDVA